MSDTAVNSQNFGAINLIVKSFATEVGKAPTGLSKLDQAQRGKLAEALNKALGSEQFNADNVTTLTDNWSDIEARLGKQDSHRATVKDKFGETQKFGQSRGTEHVKPKGTVAGLLLEETAAKSKETTKGEGAQSVQSTENQAPTPRPDKARRKFLHRFANKVMTKVGKVAVIGLMVGLLATSMAPAFAVPPVGSLRQSSRRVGSRC